MGCPDVGGAAGALATHTGPDSEPGINGSIRGRHFPQPVINTIAGDSLEEALAKVERAGGSMIHGPNEVPGVGIPAYCTDSEGNIFGLHQPLIG